MSVQQCVSEKMASPQQCQAAYDNAVQQNDRVAPRFEDGNACDRQFGNCKQVVEDGKVSWIPPMTGFLIGYAANQLINNRRVDCNQNPEHKDCAGSGRSYGHSMPIYRDYTTSNYYTPNNRNVGKSTGFVHGAAGSELAPIRAATISRGGFGTSGASRSSFGGRHSGGHFGG